MTNARLRCMPLFLLAIVFCRAPLAATNWTQPTPEELKMASDPKAPGAPAEYLYLQDSAFNGVVDVYARIKIFTEKGKQDYADIRMDYLQGDESIGSIEGRTIHADGTVIPYTGQPYDKELVSVGGYRQMEKVFTLPDVQVGSILEYRYRIFYSSSSSPVWYVQQELFVRKASFHFEPRSDLPLQTTWILPPGVSITGSRKTGFDLAMEDIPPLPDEDFSPPVHALGYRVQFLYTDYKNASDFWKAEGKQWSFDVNVVTSPNGQLKDAVKAIVAPGDTDEQKLRAIYAAVMKIENTDFTRERTKEENKAQKIKIKTANDIWKAQRGDSADITLLFITMARAARLKAYAMLVTDRSRNIFLQGVPDWDQLDDLIAIVNVDGKEMFFDPGERYCEFGKLKWMHTWTGGVRQTDDGESDLATTPTCEYANTLVTRHADLQMDADGTLHGTISITMTGDSALRWRQVALGTDEEATKKSFDDDLKEDMPPGVQVKTRLFTALADFTQPLVATVDVTGTLGTKTGHRLFLPASFFEAQTRTPFTSAARQSQVYMRYPYVVEDQFRLTLPPAAAVDSVPQDAQIPFLPNADFVEKYRTGDGAYRYARRMRLANILYDTKDYAPLREFFQKISAQDQSQVVVKVAPAANPAAGAGR